MLGRGRDQLSNAAEENSEIDITKKTLDLATRMVLGQKLGSGGMN